MEDLSLGSLYITLLVLILLSGFFSSSEPGLMAINKYRLRHLANKGHRGAKLAQKLLRTPDRLIGLILLVTGALTGLIALLSVEAALFVFAFCALIGWWTGKALPQVSG